jgi:hypothetical protein
MDWIVDPVAVSIPQRNSAVHECQGEAFLGVGEATSFWKRGSFRSGSNIGSSRSKRESPIDRLGFAKTLITLITLTASFPRKVFGKRDRSAMGPRSDRVSKALA